MSNPDVSIIEQIKDATNAIVEIAGKSETDRAEYIASVTEAYNKLREAVLPIVDEACLIMSKCKFCKYEKKYWLKSSDIKELSRNFAEMFALERGYDYETVYKLILNRNQIKSAQVFANCSNSTKNFYAFDI